jgi:hypothetical protein
MQECAARKFHDLAPESSRIVRLNARCLNIEAGTLADSIGAFHCNDQEHPAGSIQ